MASETVVAGRRPAVEELGDGGAPDEYPLGWGLADLAIQVLEICWRGSRTSAVAESRIFRRRPDRAGSSGKPGNTRGANGGRALGRDPNSATLVDQKGTPNLSAAWFQRGEGARKPIKPPVSSDSSVSGARCESRG